MGSSKPALEWHGSTLVRRVAGIVARGVGGPVVLVRSPGQSLPLLPADFEILEDLEEGRGPLGGLSAALEALAGRGEIAYVSSTDVPFLHPSFVRRVLGELGSELDACVPFVRGLRHPLAAAYRVGLAPLVKRLVTSDQLRVSALFDDCRWRQLDESDLLADADLARLDPGLESVTNLNDQYDYQAARDRLPPAIQVQWLSGGPGSRLPAQSGTPADAGGAARVTIRAATLGAAAEAFDVVLGSNIVAALNGEPGRQDPEEPLVEGDVGVFATEAGG